MALETQNVAVSFSQGLDTKTDPKQLVIGKMTSLQNASFRSPKQIKKRDGFQALSTSTTAGGTVSSGVGIASFQNELVSLDGSQLYSYSPDVGKQVPKGLLVPVGLSVFPVKRNANTQSSPDSAYDPTTGLQCFVWSNGSASGNSLQYSIVDSTSGGTIVSSGQIDGANGKTVKVVYNSGNFVIVYSDVSGGVVSIYYRAINTATPTVLGSQVTIAASALLLSATPFDVTVSGTSVYIAYVAVTSAAITFYSLSSSLVLSSPYSITTAVTGPLAIKGDASGNIWAAWGYLAATAVRAAVVNSALTSTVLAVTPIDTTLTLPGAITLTISGTTATIYYQDTTGPGWPFVKKNTLTLAGVAGTASVLMRGCAPASKAFTVLGTDYLLVLYAGTGTGVASIEASYFLINGSGKVIAKVAPNDGGLYYQSNLLPEVTAIGGSKYLFSYLIRDAAFTGNGYIYFNAGVNAGTFDFSNSQAPSKIVSGQNLLIASGQLWMYDGTNVVEHGFHVYPEEMSAGFATSGGGIGSSLNFNASGPNQVQYMGIYRWIDAQGNTHRSAPSPAVTVQIPTVTPITFTGNTTANSNQLTNVSSFTGLVVGQVLTDTTNAGNLVAGTYIAAINQLTSTITLSVAANATHAGDNYSTKDVCTASVSFPTLRQTLKSNVALDLYRTENNQTIFYLVSSFNNPVLSDPTVDTVTITDSLPDSQIVGNLQLYTTGGEVPNINAPAVSALSTFKSRALYLSPENPFQFGYSKQVIGGSPVEFDSLEFVENIDQTVIKASAIGPIDDKLIVFGPNKKFYVVGSGPSPSGANNDFSEATPIAGTTGCSNQNSILELPIGLVYQDPQKGIWLLDRSLQEVYIGADVQQYNGYQITSASLVPSSNRALFTLSNGVTLSYDYYLQQWETDIYAVEAFDSTIYQGTFCYIQPNGVIQQQTIGLYTDNGSLIPMGFTTGWMNFAQIEGFARVLELQIAGTYVSPHTLTINVFNDYANTASQTVTIPVLSNPGLYQFRIHLKVQKCEAIQVQLSESQSGSIGEGFSLSALAFRVGVRKGLTKLPAGVSY